MASATSLLLLLNTLQSSDSEAHYVIHADTKRVSKLEKKWNSLRSDKYGPNFLHLLLSQAAYDRATFCTADMLTKGASCASAVHAPDYGVPSKKRGIQRARVPACCRGQGKRNVAALRVSLICPSRPNVQGSRTRCAIQQSTLSLELEAGR